MIFKNLFRRKARSLLTILGVAIGVAAVVALGAMAEGLADGYAAITSGSGADLLVSQADALDIALSAVDERVGERIAQMPAVQHVSGVIYSFVNTEGIPYFIVGGYDPDEVAIRHFKIIEGQPLSHEKQIILGKQAAANLKKKVGDTLKLYDDPYRIVGIFETGLSFEEGGAVISLADAQAMFKKPRQVSFFEVQLRDPEASDVVKERVERLFPNVSVSKASDVGEKQMEVRMMKGLAWGLGLIAVLIGGLGMMNTMIMAVFEQTREIGVLRAVGWRRGQVLRLILGQSLALSLLGGVAGIGLGLGLVYLINQTLAVSSFTPGVVKPPLLFQAMSVALVLGVVGGFYPAWRAAGLSPIEALRYEGGGGGDRGKEPRWARLGGMAFRNLWRQRGRSLLTMIGIAVGVGLVVSLGALLDGIIKSFTELNAGSGAELVALQAEVADMSLSAIDERIGRAIAAMPQVEDVSGLVFGVAQGEGVPFLIVWGLDPNERAIRHYRIVEGRRISRRSEIMLGRAAAENLKKRVGDVLRLPNGLYRVVGIYETGIAYEEGAGVIALKDAQAAFRKPRQVGFYQIKLRDPSQAETVRRLIEHRFGDEVSVSLVADFVENTEDIKNTKAMLGAVFALAMLVGGVVVMNTMVMAVMERTREIGTLRAVGWRQSRVLGMILSESLALSAVSGGLGIVVGIGLAEAMSSAPAMAGLLKAEYTPTVFAEGMGVALLLGAVGGLYPAWRASRLRPVEALRYE